VAVEVPADKRELTVDELERWTEYRVWMLAGTSVGDGPVSYPVTVKTDEDGKQGTISMEQKKEKKLQQICLIGSFY